MRRHRGLAMAAGALALVALPAEAAPAQGYQLVTIVDATPGRCSVRTTAPSCYSPASLSVTAGTTVEWYNRSSLAHTVTGVGSNGGWGSGTINANAIYTHTFDAPGSYSYHCTIHTGMNGVVYVYDPNASTSSSSSSTGSGQTSFSISSPQTQPFTSTSSSSAASSSTTTATSATATDTTDSGDLAVVNGADTSSDSASSHSSAPAAVLKPGGGSGPSAVLVAVLLLLLIGGSSTAALVLTRPGRAARR